MPAAASLSVSLVARISKFRRGMRSARKEIRTFGDSAKRLSSTLKNVRNQLLLAFGGAALIGGIKKITESLLGLIDTSEKLGFTATELLALRDAAERTGVDVSQMDTAFQRAFRRIAEAAKGSGEAKDAIKELGLEAEGLLEMSPADRVQALADAFDDVKRPADKLRLAMKLFDSEGVNVLRTLEEIADQGLDKLIRRNKELGRSLSVDQVEGLKKLRVAWEDFKDQIGGVLIQFVAKAGPKLIAMARQLSASFEMNRPAIESMLARLRDIPDIAARIESSVLAIRDAIQEVTEWVEIFEIIGRKIAHGWAQLWSIIKNIVDLLGQAAGMFQAVGGNVAAHAKELFRPGSTPESARDALTQPIPEIRGMSLAESLEKAADVPAPFRPPDRKSGRDGRGEVVKLERDGVDLSPMLQLLGEIARNTAQPRPATAG